MTVYNLNCYDMGLPPTVKAGDILIYTGGWIQDREIYRLYEDGHLGLRMRREYNMPAELMADLDAAAAATGKRIVAIGNGGGLTAVDAEWAAQAEADDLAATMDAAANRAGY